VETTLWRIFKCLVDGLSVLEFGNEIKWDSVKGEAVSKPRINWNELVHFDLKPPNSKLFLVSHLFGIIRTNYAQFFLVTEI